MSDIERKAFEKCSLIPSDAEFHVQHQMYQHKQYNGVIEHPINGLWESFCDGAQWQARTQDATGNSCNCEASKNLLEIHKIAACISEVEGLDGTEQLTVSRVKQMAQYINHMKIGRSEL